MQKDSPDYEKIIEKEHEETPSKEFEERWGIDPSKPEYTPVPDEKKN